jgi:uncharacterized protein HemX
VARAARVLLLVLALALAAIAPLAPASSAAAQDSPTTTSVVEVPAQDIVPRPNSGHEPTEAGDRGGALQLGILAIVVVAIGAAVLHLRRQSQRARAATGDQTAS